MIILMKKKKQKQLTTKTSQPPSMVYKGDKFLCQALNDFTSPENDKISFKKSDILVISKTNDDWWYGEISGQPEKQGWVPRGYLKIMEQGR